MSVRWGLEGLSEGGGGEGGRWGARKSKSEADQGRYSAGGGIVGGLMLRGEVL